MAAIRNEIGRYLARVVLDDAFRRLAEDDPERSFEGFDLDDDEKDVLMRQDRAVLGLLGKALRGPASDGATSDGATSSDQPGPAGGRAPAPTSPGSAVMPLPSTGFVVRVQPYLTSLPDGNTALTWTTAVEPLPGGVLPAPPPTPAEAAGQATAPHPTPWRHRVDGDDVLAAAEAVRGAPPDARYERILDLVRAMKGAP